MKSLLLPAAFAALAVAALAQETAADAAKRDDHTAPPASSSPVTKPAVTSTPALDASVQGTPSTAPVAGADTAATAPNKPKQQDATMLPQVEVNKSRITNLDIQIDEKQREIDREKQHSTPTKLDSALNDGKVAKVLSIFGGSSADDRAGIAKQRAEILTEEKEILEAMKTAQSKEEKAELQQELELLKQSRRELDGGPR